MQISDIHIDESGRETTERGTPLFPLSVHEADLRSFGSAGEVPWHWHDECEFVLVTEGELQVDYAGACARLPEGCAAYVNSGVLHAIRPHAPGPCRMQTIVFDPIVIGERGSMYHARYVLPVVQDQVHTAHIIRGNAPWEQSLLRLVGEILDADAAGGTSRELRIRSRLSECWLLIMEHGGSTAPAPPEDPYIKTMLSFVHAHFADDLTLEMIAKIADVSCRTCSRSFRSQLRMSPVAYVVEYRCRRAADLLASSDMTITEVSFSCGFRDPSYFSRQFRSSMGMSPSAYRKAARGGARGM